MNGTMNFENVSEMGTKNVISGGRISGLGHLEGETVSIAIIKPSHRFTILGHRFPEPRIEFNIQGPIQTLKLLTMHLIDWEQSKVRWNFRKSPNLKQKEYIAQLNSFEESIMFCKWDLEHVSVNSLKIPNIIRLEQKIVKNGIVSGLTSLEGHNVMVMSDKTAHIIEIILDNRKELEEYELKVYIQGILAGTVYLSKKEDIVFSSSNLPELSLSMFEPESNRLLARTLN